MVGVRGVKPHNGYQSAADNPYRGSDYFKCLELAILYYSSTPGDTPMEDVYQKAAELYQHILDTVRI